MSNPILKIEHLGKSFGAVRALDDITMTINKGEIHAICGENGAGKSTLMKILDGFYPHGSYHGNFYVDGQECRFQSPKDSTHAGIAMIYQEISILEFMSLADNIMAGNYPLKNGIIDKKETHRIARKYLDMVDLKISSSAKAVTLNTSQRQLLMIAQALSHNPKILILDEPTSALTQRESQKLLSIIGHLRDQGVTCVYISHKLDELSKIADRLSIIRDGCYIETLNRGEFDINRIITGMVGRSIQSVYPTRNTPIGEVVLEVEGLSVPHPHISGRYMVKDLSFNLRRGEVLGFAGLVGAGRSEALGALYGYLKKSGGDITLFGKKASINSPTDALNAGIALLTEDRKATGLFEQCNIRENTTSASLKKVSTGGVLNRKLEREAADQYIQQMRVKTPSQDNLITSLSGGNQQKVVLAKALMTQPKILLLDEPTRGIDVGSKHEIYQLINSMLEEGYSIIMISSELPELLNMSDRVIVMADGKKQAELSKEEATEQAVMRAATGAGAADSGEEEHD